jgi:hypothetical protein
VHAIRELSQRYQDWADDFFGQLGGASPIADEVNWEVGPGGFNRPRVDILYAESEIYEAKLVTGSDTAAISAAVDQANGYRLNNWGNDGSRIKFDLGRRLRTWSVWFYGPPEDIFDALRGHGLSKYWAWSPTPGVVLVSDDERKVPRDKRDSAVQGDKSAYGGFLIPLPIYDPVAPRPIAPVP